MSRNPTFLEHLLYYSKILSLEEKHVQFSLAFRSIYPRPASHLLVPLVWNSCQPPGRLCCPFPYPLSHQPARHLTQPCGADGLTLWRRLIPVTAQRRRDDRPPGPPSRDVDELFHCTDRHGYFGTGRISLAVHAQHIDPGL